MTTRTFLFLLGSSRTDGNTEELARLAAEQLPPETEQRWLNLNELTLPDFEDLRHDGDGRYPAPTGNAATLLDATLGATDLVLASPLYWYAMSTSTKRYLDHWSGWMRVPGVDFKQRMGGRTLWGVTALATSDLERRRTGDGHAADHRLVHADGVGRDAAGGRHPAR